MATTVSPSRDPTSTPRQRRDTDDGLDKRWTDEQRKRIEVTLLKSVDEARRERDAKLAVENNAVERARIESNYEAEMQSLRAIAEDQFQQLYREEVLRRKMSRGRAKDVPIPSIEQRQKQILEDIKMREAHLPTTTPSDVQRDPESSSASGDESGGAGADKNNAEEAEDSEEEDEWEAGDGEDGVDGQENGAREEDEGGDDEDEDGGDGSGDQDEEEDEDEDEALAPHSHSRTSYPPVQQTSSSPSQTRQNVFIRRPPSRPMERDHSANTDDFDEDDGGLREGSPSHQRRPSLSNMGSGRGSGRRSSSGSFSRPGGPMRPEFWRPPSSGQTVEPSGISRTFAHAQSFSSPSPARRGSVNSVTGVGSSLQRSGSMNSPAGPVTDFNHMDRERTQTKARSGSTSVNDRPLSGPSPISLALGSSPRKGDSSHSYTVTSARPIPGSRTSYQAMDDPIRIPLSSSPSSRVIIGPQRSPEEPKSGIAIPRGPQTPDDNRGSWISGRSLRSHGSFQELGGPHRSVDVPYGIVRPHYAEDEYDIEYSDGLGDLDRRRSLRSMGSVRSMRSFDLEQQAIKREQEARKKEEEAMKMEEAARLKAEEARKMEEEAKARAEEAKLLAEEAQRKEKEAVRKAEEARKKEAEARRMEAEIKRRHEEAQQREEEMRLKEREAQRLEMEMKRKEQELQEKAEYARRREEEMKQKEVEARRKEQEARKKDADLKRREQELREREEALSRREAQAKVEAQQKQEKENKAAKSKRREEALAQKRKAEGDKRREQEEEEERQRREADIQRREEELERREADVAQKEEERLKEEEERRAQEAAEQASNLLRMEEADTQPREPETEGIVQEEDTKPLEEDVKTQTEEEREMQRLIEEAERLAEEERRLEREREEQLQRALEERFEREREKRAKRQEEEDLARALEESRRQSILDEQQRAQDSQRQAGEDHHHREDDRRREDQRERERVQRERDDQRQREFRRTQEELNRRAEDRRRQDSLGSNSGTRYVPSPSTPNTGPWPQHATSSSPSDRNSSSSTWSTSTGPSWGSRPTSVSSAATGSSRTTNAAPSSGAKNVGGGGRSTQPSNHAGAPGTSPHPSMLDEAEWTRRQEERARKQQEQFLREQERLDRERELKASKVLSADDLKHLYSNHEQKWQTLKTGDGFGWDSFPWPMFKRPSEPEDITTAQVGAYVLSPHSPSTKNSKDRIKDHIKRWHPDRFETKILPKVVEEDREKVKAGAGWVARSLNELLSRKYDD